MRHNDLVMLKQQGVVNADDKVVLALVLVVLVLVLVILVLVLCWWSWP